MSLPDGITGHGNLLPAEDGLFAPDGGSEPSPLVDESGERILRLLGSEAGIISDGAENAREACFGSRFKVVREIGSGGMGMVFEAFDRLFRRKVAIKMVKPGLTQREKGRLRIEAMAVAQVSHPHICPIYDMVDSGDNPFLVMRLIEGEVLNRRFGRNRLRMEPNQACALIRKVALAMHAVHLRGVVHRDLKPGNIMLEHGEPIIMDFGLARLDPANRSESDLSISVQGNPIGTRPYMPPEQVRGSSIETGPRSDIFSLGVVLYEILTSTLPFNGSEAELFRAICEIDPEPPSSRIQNHIIDHELDQIVLKCLQKRPAKRFDSMLEFAEKLREWMSRTDDSEVNQDSTIVPESPGFSSQQTLDHVPMLLQLANTNVAYRPEPGQRKIQIGRQRRVSDQPAEPGNDLVVRMANNSQLSINISRLHLEINQGTNGEWCLVDKSTRGTLLNGGRVIGHQACPLKHGDRIAIAGLLEWIVCLLPTVAFEVKNLSQVEQTLAGNTSSIDLDCSRGSLGLIDASQLSG
jgi:serine/threonine protein kinase